MRKIWLIIIILIIFLGMVGYIIFLSLQDIQQKKNTTIRYLLTKKTNLVCNYTDVNKNLVKAYIQDGAIRVDLKLQDSTESKSIIIKDQKLYAWSVKDKRGFVLDVSQESGSTATGIQSQINSIINDIDKYKSSCVEATEQVPGSMFTAPTEIEYIDILHTPTPEPTQIPGLTPKPY